MKNLLMTFLCLVFASNLVYADGASLHNTTKCTIQVRYFCYDRYTCNIVSYGPPFTMAPGTTRVTDPNDFPHDCDVNTTKEGMEVTYASGCSSYVANVRLDTFGPCFTTTFSLPKCPLCDLNPGDYDVSTTGQAFVEGVFLTYP